MNHKSIIFDWSGVVRDAVANQLWVTNFILNKFGVRDITMEELRENWEQPYWLFYEKYLPTGFSLEEQSKAYREAISHVDCPKSPATVGIVELIKTIKNKGYFVAVVSSDPTDTFLLELKEYGLENIFNEIVLDVHDKFEAAEKIIKNNNLDRSYTYFVGDSNHEIDVSQKVGIKSVAVTWGFTSEGKLRAKNPDYIINSVQELESLIC